MMTVVHDGGALLVPECGLWLDPKRPAARAFVSHAHADHIGSHRWTLCTLETARLMTARIRAGGEVLEARCRERIDLGNGWSAVLLPAGHVLGSAMLHLTAPDGSTLLYTGDFKLRMPLASEPCEPKRADILVIETTYGLPQYVFPPFERVAEQLVNFCRATLEEGGTPVLFAYSLGKAQEVAEIVDGAGLPLMAHDAVVKISRLCRELRGGGVVPARHAARSLPGHVLLVPPSAASSPIVRTIERRRVASVTGWALRSGTRHRHGADAVFPLSDHADYHDLIATVHLVQPSQVFTVHGFTREFAADLRRRGFDARAIGCHEQLDLDIPDTPRAAALPENPHPDDSRIAPGDDARKARRCD